MGPRFVIRAFIGALAIALVLATVTTIRHVNTHGSSHFQPAARWLEHDRAS